MKSRKVSANVFVTDDEIVQVDRSVVDMLREAAPGAPLKRVRFNAHGGAGEVVQEMILAVSRDSYIPPHKHPGKSESFHIVEGEVDVVLFDDGGQIREVVHLGNLLSGKPFYYRTSQAYFHAVVIQSDFAIFHETTNGPFIKEETILAPWAPRAEGPVAEKYLAGLREALKDPPYRGTSRETT
jgi:cupin fold WbuC family metalloprotein